MATNPPIGNNAWEGVLGVVDIYYNGIYQGRTTADTEMAVTEDVKDIIFQQTGTQYDDKVPTGASHSIVCTFGQITTSRIEQWHPGFEASSSGNSLKMGRNIYVSWKDNAKVLELIRVDSEGTASTDPRHKITFYKAHPGITGNFQWGADTQRNLNVTFFIFYDDSESAFGYSGFATSVGLTPIPNPKP
jgi:hypothetical protein